MADIQIETPPVPLADPSAAETAAAPAAGQTSATVMEPVVPQASEPPPPPKAVVANSDNGKEEAPAKPAGNGDVSANGMMEALQNSIIAGNIPQIVLHMITYATSIGASDIHIEPLENIVRIRFRVDGVLRLIIEYPSNIHPAVVSRVKIMSGLKIDEQRIPQDGRMQITTEDGKELDLRVSTLPTVNGEKIVSRIQDKSKTIPDLPNLGIQGENMKKMERFLKLPNGVILVTGPTGSGKTNTLYSTLSRLNVIGVNIMTFEDPVEYQMDGLSQSQVKPEIDYDFASGLRTALRQDPDIIMVGEIRDQETIEIAIRAALTGHLVLSTVHTNSAVGTLTRISDMGLPGYLTASAIRGIIAQRLVRRVCSDCKELYAPEGVLLTEIKKELADVREGYMDPKLLENPQLARGKGCDKCGGTGSKGRMGIFEIMEMDRDIGELILKNATDSALMDQAKKNGMITLKQDGYIKALQGDIPIEEVYRVVQ
ncbi:type II/IV secretion system protein [Candidatus Peregrinibacteria bacterium]|nr:type II/IV secretion system protein [Candidatus Peregrinibacteria bacterium]